MNILIPANIDYYYAALIMLRSLFLHNKDSKMVIYLFYSELKKKRLAKLRHLIETNHGELYEIKINDSMLKDLPVGWLSKETYYRMLAPSLLPADLDRILYLDLDMIIRGSIKEIYETDFQDNLFMAVPDALTEDAGHKKMLRMKKDSVYVNVGVLLMNLKLLREEFDLKKALDYAVRYPERVPNCDQDLINGMYFERIGHLDWKYNYEARFHSIKEIFAYPFLAKHLLEEIRIIHYMGWKKPWKPGFDGKFLREYYRYARRTPYEETVRENIQKRYWNVIKLIGQMAADGLKKKVMNIR